jgi:hypothetical protein
MKKIYFILAILFASVSLNANNYKSALGVRGLFDAGLTYKQFLDNTKAFEVILSGGKHWIGLTGFYQWHNKTHNSQLEWYYGGGAHIVFIDGKDRRNTPWKRDTDTDIVIGVDGILGIEYALKEVPIVFSLDWNPTVNLIGDTGLWLTRGSVSIRYYW